MDDRLFIKKQSSQIHLKRGERGGTDAFMSRLQAKPFPETSCICCNKQTILKTAG